MAVCVFFGTFAWTDMFRDGLGGVNIMAYFPFFADIEGMKWLIAGGGGVALRKVRDLLPYGAVIEVVSPDMSHGLDEMAADSAYADCLTLTRRGFEDRDLDGADFVIAATSEPDLNSRISALCRSKRIPVNVVDVKEECSFIFPSIVREGPVVVGISTGGMSPVIARYLKASIQSVMPDGLGALTAQLGAYRQTIKDLFPDSPRVRSALFNELAEEGLSHNGCLSREQAQIIINRKLEQKHE
ncbi:MAG: bifunctional precorrin-2 dehydrogenase/sirohydrochlorin ferrochelatase [Enterocloster clostridioformis]|nr:bifunctional precorrin-2 dehydrogenase/sirohydrochlorin ferrochelatase [Enterocloster clostridioformis]